MWSTAPLSDAAAPNVTIAAVGSVDEDDTLALSASVSGGTYDSLSYAWSVISGGGSIAGGGANVTYDPPNVSSDTAVTVRCTVTATGTGNNAENGTSDTDADDEIFTVNVVTTRRYRLQNAPNVTIAAVGSVDEDDNPCPFGIGLWRHLRQPLLRMERDFGWGDN